MNFEVKGLYNCNVEIDKKIIVIEGQLNEYNIKKIFRWADENDMAYIFDMKEVNFISSSAMHMLIKNRPILTATNEKLHVAYAGMKLLWNACA